MKITVSQRRIFALLVCGWILMTIVRQTNHLLAPSGLSIWLGGLIITVAALHLNPKTGFAGCFLLGLMMDAWSPLGFGTHALLFGAAQIIIGRIRNRFAAQELTIGITVALITNLILFVFITFIAIGRSSGATISGVRLLSDLVLSQILLALITPWFFALQNRAFDLVINPRTARARSTA